MDGKMKEFLELYNNKSNRVVYNILKKISDLGYEDDFLQTYKSVEDIERIILDLQPTSIRAITTICYAFGLYAKFVGDNNAYNNLQNVDRNNIWKIAKITAPSKYISFKRFLDVIHDIAAYQETNALYYETLFRTIYEGVYNDDLSVVANLKGSDINIKENIVELHTDEGYSYKMLLSSELLNNLKELSEIDTWEQKNRYGVYTVDITGKSPDSCFKMNHKNLKESDNSAYRFSYYKRLRYIAKEYVEYSITPAQIFVSGIMHRICSELENNNVSIERAFAYNNKDEMVNGIINKELSRCEYDISSSAFREQVSGYLEVFA